MCVCVCVGVFVCPDLDTPFVQSNYVAVIVLLLFSIFLPQEKGQKAREQILGSKFDFRERNCHT